jgi:uridylate kinase
MNEDLHENFEELILLFSDIRRETDRLPSHEAEIVHLFFQFRISFPAISYISELAPGEIQNIINDFSLQLFANCKRLQNLLITSSVGEICDRNLCGVSDTQTVSALKERLSQSVKEEMNNPLGKKVRDLIAIAFDISTPDGPSKHCEEILSNILQVKFPKAAAKAYTCLRGGQAIGFMPQSKYKRVLLKLSGECFCKTIQSGIDREALFSIAERIIEICRLGTQLAVVIGAGNFFRGKSFSKISQIPRNTADYMGMLATIINACALQKTLEKIGQEAIVLSSIEVPTICEGFIRRRAIRHMEESRVVILAGGTGIPFLTTDTCAALRASELDVDLIIKATKIDGIYSDDPKKNPDAVCFKELSFEEVFTNELRVMDHLATNICRENNIPIIVLNIFKDSDMTKALCGEQVGTKIHNR